MMNTSSSSAPERERAQPLPPPHVQDAAGVLCRPAEGAFKKGILALRRGETKVARALFEAAIQLERESGAIRIQPRFLSYYGLTLMEQPGTVFKAREWCLRATRDEFFNPDLFLNLSKVQAKTGDRGGAYRAAARGLALDPRHPALRQQLAELGVRRSPPLRFLGRSSSLNILLGLILRRKRQHDRH